MNNVLSFCLFFLVFYGSASAQQLGFKGGLNFTNVSSDKDLNLATSNGFHAGIAFETPILFPLAMGTGIFYTRRGYQSDEPGRVGTVTIDYLDIPVDFMVKIKVADLVGAYVSVGPYFSYGLSSQVFNIEGVLENGYDNEDINLNRLDTGMNVGAGVDVTNIRLSVSYGFSFADNGAEQDNRLENRVLRISVGYFFE